MGDEAFDFIGLPFNDAASINMMMTEMNDSSGRWSYARQLYGHVYTAKLGTLSELVGAGDMHNQQHITLAGYEKKPSRLSMNWLPVALPVKRYLCE